MFCFHSGVFRCISLRASALILVAITTVVTYIRILSSGNGETLQLGNFFMGIGEVDESRSSLEPQACLHPKLLLWHPQLKSYLDVPKPLRCSESEENWVYTTNGTFRISDNAVRKHGKITCTCAPIYQGRADLGLIRGNGLPKRNGELLMNDVFEAHCVGADGKSRKDVHVGIAPNEKVRARKKIKIRKSSLDLDILMFGYDSVSRMTWLRNLPISYNLQLPCRSSWSGCSRGIQYRWRCNT